MSITDRFKSIINKIAVFIGVAAPVAEAIEEVVAPAAVAPTKIVESVAAKIEEKTR